MEQHALLPLVQSMIISSTKHPKYAVLSTAKIAHLLNSSTEEVEQKLQEFVSAGTLRKSKLDDSPGYDIYLLP